MDIVKITSILNLVTFLQKKKNGIPFMWLERHLRMGKKKKN